MAYFRPSQKSAVQSSRQAVHAGYRYVAASSLRAKASCACRRRRPMCRPSITHAGHCHHAGSLSSMMGARPWGRGARFSEKGLAWAPALASVPPPGGPVALRGPSLPPPYSSPSPQSQSTCDPTMIDMCVSVSRICRISKEDLCMSSWQCNSIA